MNKLFFFLQAAIVCQIEVLRLQLGSESAGSIVSAQRYTDIDRENTQPLTIPRPPESVFRYMTLSDGKQEVVGNGEAQGLETTFVIPFSNFEWFSHEGRLCTFDVQNLVTIKCYDSSKNEHYIAVDSFEGLMLKRF